MAEIIKIKKQQQLLKRINVFLINYFKLIQAVVLLLIILLGYFFIILPRYQQIAESLVETKKNQSTQQEIYKNYLDDLNRLNLVYSQLDVAKLQKVNTMLPEAPLPEQLMTELQKLSEDNGIALSSLTVTPDVRNYQAAISNENLNDSEVAKLSLGKVDIRMVMVGLNYQGLKNLLAVFERNLRIVDINNLSWSPDGQLLSLGMTAYYIKR